MLQELTFWRIVTQDAFCVLYTLTSTEIEEHRQKFYLGVLYNQYNTLSIVICKTGLQSDLEIQNFMESNPFLFWLCKESNCFKKLNFQLQS